MALEPKKDFREEAALDAFLMKDGDKKIAAKFRVSPRTVARWRQKFGFTHNSPSVGGVTESASDLQSKVADEVADAFGGATDTVPDRVPPESIREPVAWKNGHWLSKAEYEGEGGQRLHRLYAGKDLYDTWDDSIIGLEGAKGGLVSPTAEIGPDAWVAPNAMALDNAKILDSARLFEEAVARDNVILSDEAEMSGNAEASGNAQMRHNSKVRQNGRTGDYANLFDEALVEGNAQVGGHVRLRDSASVNGNARVSGDAQVSGLGEIGGHAIVDGRTMVGDFAYIFENAHVTDIAIVKDHARIGGDTVVQKDMIVGDYTEMLEFTGSTPPEVKTMSSADAKTIALKADESLSNMVGETKVHEVMGDISERTTYLARFGAFKLAAEQAGFYGPEVGGVDGFAVKYADRRPTSDEGYSIGQKTDSDVDATTTSEPPTKPNRQKKALGHAWPDDEWSQEIKDTAEDVIADYGLNAEDAAALSAIAGWATGEQNAPPVNIGGTPSASTPLHDESGSLAAYKYDSAVEAKAQDKLHQTALHLSHNVHIDTFAKYPFSDYDPRKIHDARHQDAVDDAMDLTEALLRSSGYNVALPNKDGEWTGAGGEIEHPNAPFAVLRYNGTFKDVLRDDGSEAVWVNMRVELFRGVPGDTPDDWTVEYHGEIDIGLGDRKVLFTDVYTNE